MKNTGQSPVGKPIQCIDCPFYDRCPDEVKSSMFCPQLTPKSKPGESIAWLTADALTAIDIAGKN